MSNPVFRAKLKQKRLWSRLVMGLKQLFGIKTDGSDSSTAYDELSSALDVILDSFDARLYERYTGKKIPSSQAGTGQLSTDSSSDGQVRSARRSPTDTPGVPFDAAKVRKITGTAKNNIKKFKNGDGYVDTRDVGKMLASLRRLFGMSYAGKSNYGVFDTPNGRFAFRLANHNAFGDNFAQDNAEQNVSVYVALNEYNVPESQIPYQEYKVLPEAFEAHREEFVRSLIDSMDSVLRTGEFIPPAYSVLVHDGTSEVSPFHDDDFFASYKELTPEQKAKVQVLGTRAAMAFSKSIARCFSCCRTCAGCCPFTVRLTVA